MSASFFQFLRKIFFVQLCVACLFMSNDVVHADEPEHLIPSTLLAQAYEHFKLDESILRGVSEKGIELYVKNDILNKVLLFLDGRDKDLSKVDAIIVDLIGDKNVVHFLGKDVTGAVKNIFGVEVKGKKMTFVHFPKLAKRFTDMFTIYKMAESSVKGPCNQNYNIIIIKSDDGYDVYSVVAQPHDKSIILGGHFLLRFVPDGDNWKISEYRPFDTVCVPVNKSFVDNEGYIALNYAALPNIIHSFLSIQYQQRILINTGEQKLTIINGVVEEYVKGKE